MCLDDPSSSSRVPPIPSHTLSSTSSSSSSSTSTSISTSTTSVSLSSHSREHRWDLLPDGNIAHIFHMLNGELNAEMISQRLISHHWYRASCRCDAWDGTCYTLIGEILRIRMSSAALSQRLSHVHHMTHGYLRELTIQYHRLTWEMTICIINLQHLTTLNLSNTEVELGPIPQQYHKHIHHDILKCINHDNQHYSNDNQHAIESNTSQQHHTMGNGNTQHSHNNNLSQRTTPIDDPSHPSHHHYSPFLALLYASSWPHLRSLIAFGARHHVDWSPIHGIPPCPTFASLTNVQLPLMLALPFCLPSHTHPCRIPNVKQLFLYLYQHDMNVLEHVLKKYQLISIDAHEGAGQVAWPNHTTIPQESLSIPVHHFIPSSLSKLQLTTFHCDITSWLIACWFPPGRPLSLPQLDLSDDASFLGHLNAVRHISGLRTSLEALDLQTSVFDELNTETRPQYDLNDFINLEIFHITDVIGMNDEHVTCMNIHTLPKLHTLHISCATQVDETEHAPINGSFFSSWSAHCMIHTISLRDCWYVTDTAVAAMVKACPSLTQVDLSDTNITDDAIQHLCQRPLKRLIIQMTKVSDSGISLLCSFSSACHDTLFLLSIIECRITPSILSHLIYLSSLKTLGIGGYWRSLHGIYVELHSSIPGQIHEFVWTDDVRDRIEHDFVEKGIQVVRISSSSYAGSDPHNHIPELQLHFKRPPIQL